MVLSLRLLSGSAVLLAGSLVPAAEAAAPTYPAEGLTCGLATAGGPRQLGTVSGGPVVVTDAALSVTYECTVLVVTPTATTVAAIARFETPGAVGVLPPTPVDFRADPARDRVVVCTFVEWFFPFPSGGAAELGCRDARVVRATGGYVLAPSPAP